MIPRPGGVSCRSAAGSHRMAYLEWGDTKSDRALLCVHGLTGNARDFDELAPALSQEGYRVVCPDLVGRGASDWLSDPSAYGLRQYVADVEVLLRSLGLHAVDWVGTSLGGLIGMALAGRPPGTVRRLVLNDIGPAVPSAALTRLGTTLGDDPSFADIAEAERWLRAVRGPFGPLSDAQWLRMAERSVRRAKDGSLRLHYDPGIATTFARTSGRDLDLWSLWESIACPVLVLRGEHSDLLLRKTGEEVRERGPGAEVVEIPGCGHAPALVDPEQIAVVTRWLQRTAD